MAMKQCPCCGKSFDSRGFKVHVLFCCGRETVRKFSSLKKLDFSFLKKLEKIFFLKKF